MDPCQPFLCIVEDDPTNRQALQQFLQRENFHVASFTSATDFLSQYVPGSCDLLISDINMPGPSGFDLCRTLRSMVDAVRLPVILITGGDPSLDQSLGFEAGADEFISKPFAARSLVAKIRSLLEIRARETRQHQELESSKGLNADLARFLSPNIARRMGDQQGFLQPHRTEVTVLFTDLRRFTAFSEKFEPEEVLEVLQQYYTVVGRAAMKHKGTLGHLAGDGVMIFFNDPEPIKDHGEVALRMALEAREDLLKLKNGWNRLGYDIDFGMGLGSGFATIGGIGFDRFAQYSVIGTVANFASRLCLSPLPLAFASRLCHIAEGGQILVSHRFLGRMGIDRCRTIAMGEMALRGIEERVRIFDVLSLDQLKAS